MTQVVPTAQKEVNLAAWIAANPNWSLRLFGNDATPADSSVVGDFTEISGAGYARVTLASASWTISAVTPSVAAYAAQSFVFTGALDSPGTIYGYYIVDNAGNLVTAERLASPPFTPATNGDAVIVVPQIALADLS